MSISGFIIFFAVYLGTFCLSYLCGYAKGRARREESKMHPIDFSV